VYRVNDKPVPLLYGILPPYRALRSGVSGTDVKQFEENLAALGYTGFTVDEDYTSATADAVEKWQKDLGLDQTGTVEIGQVVVAPVAIRVAALTANVGDSAVAPILTYTATTRVVDVDLDVSKQTLVKPGLAATVTLPDNSTVDGKIDSVGSVATTKNGAGGQPGTATIAVVVSIADQSRLGTLDAAPVTVSIVSDRRENVLTVPVAALVALSEGGYGVQVVQGNDAFYVAVHTGLFANGRVEITGDGITDGTVVGMPR
jgi:peptidoglycan hydrolase-like protein with peptidoglycan-binding domain